MMRVETLGDADRSQVITLRRGLALAFFLAFTTLFATALVDAVSRLAHGALPGAGITPLVILGARQPIDRVSRRIAGTDGPRLFWRGMLFVIAVLTLGVIDSAWSSFYRLPPFAFGRLPFDGIDHLFWIGVVLAAALGTAVAMISGKIMRAIAPRARIEPIASVVLVVGKLVPFALVLAKTCGSAPTPERYIAQMRVVGTFPTVAPPSTRVARAPINPSDADSYPYRFEQDIPGYRGVRYCDNRYCFLYVAPDSEPPFPEKFDASRFPKARLETFVEANEVADLCVTPDAIVFRTRNGLRDWTNRATFSRVHDPREITMGLAAPWPVVASAAAMLIIAVIALARRSRRDGLRLAGLGDDWTPATMTADGLVRFDDGRPAAQVPVGVTHTSGPVMVVVAASKTATFRDAGAPDVLRLFRGDRPALDAVGERALVGNDAWITAAAAFSAVPIIAAIYLNLVT